MRTIDTGRLQYLRTRLVFDGERERPQAHRASEHHKRRAIVVLSVSRYPDWCGFLVVTYRSSPESLCDDLEQVASIFSAFRIKRIGNHSGRNRTRRVCSARCDRDHLWE